MGEIKSFIGDVLEFASGLLSGVFLIGGMMVVFGSGALAVAYFVVYTVKLLYRLSG